MHRKNIGNKMRAMAVLTAAVLALSPSVSAAAASASVESEELLNETTGSDTATSADNADTVDTETSVDTADAETSDISAVSSDSDSAGSESDTGYDNSDTTDDSADSDIIDASVDSDNLEAVSGGPGGSSSSVTWSGATTYTSATTTTNETYTSTTADENAVLINTGSNVAVTLNNPTVTKSGGTSASDNYSFYGINSAIMAKGGGTTTIKGGTVTTTAAGANGVFSYGANNGTTNATGDGTTVNVSDMTIKTSAQGSGGIMTTYGGTTVASNLTITTTGGSSAPIRTDRGGGWVTVDGGTYTCSGTGSPTIYSTADVNVSNATLTSKASEGVCIEGNGSIELTNCSLTATNSKTNGNAKYNDTIMIYQSMSGDATGTGSIYTMTGGSLISNVGHVFHVTNTSATITLDGVAITNNDSGNVLISVANDGWSGNTNTATVNAANQTLVGNILVDSSSYVTGSSSKTSTTGSSASTLNLNLTDSSTYTGRVNNSSDYVYTKGTVNMTLASGTVWKLTGDSYVTSISGEGKVNYGNYTLYVGSTGYTASNPYSKVGVYTETTDDDDDDNNDDNDDDNDDDDDNDNTDTWESVRSTAINTTISSTAGNFTVNKPYIAFEDSSYSYTGKLIKPEPSVSFNGVALKKYADYTVAYKNNKLPGTATVTVKGVGEFKGKATASFTIDKVSLTDSGTDVIVNDVLLKKAGTATKSTLRIYAENGTLIPASNYTATYTNNTAAGTGTAVIVAKANSKILTGSTTATYVILASDKTNNKYLMSKAKISGITSKEYTGSEITQTPVVKAYDGTVLTEGTHYSIAYKNNTDAGTATAIISGMGDYCGQKFVNFKITTKKLTQSDSKLVVTLSDDSAYYYTGYAIKPLPVVTYDGTELTEGTDYTLAWSKNSKVTTAAVLKVKLKGNYSLTKTANFTIKARDWDGITVSVASTDIDTSSKKAVPAFYSGTDLITLKKGAAYTAKYTYDKSTGKVTVTVKGAGSYKGKTKDAVTYTCTG